MDRSRQASGHTARFFSTAKAVASRTVHQSLKLISSILIGAILAIRPFFGPPARCRYAITCTPYAIKQLKEQVIFVALWNIFKRVLSCNPFW